MMASRFVQRWLPVCLFVVLLAAAFSNGLRTTWQLQWPDIDQQAAGVDLYRDMGLAQTILDLGYGPDPTYLGERSWYNPLAPAIIAGVSAATGWPVHVVATQIGAYANLLAPVCFFLMCAVLFDRWTAFFASAGFLFLLSGPLPNWVSATYSPWFMPIDFVQAFFYLSVIAFYHALRDGRLRWFVAAGLLWGLTFLGHTGPALIFGGMATVWLAGIVWSAWRGRLGPGVTVGGAVQRYSLMVVLALAVSAPLLVNIVGHYGLRVRNANPSGYSEPWLSRELPALLRVHVTIPMAIVVLGVWVAITRKLRQSSRWLVFAWAGVAGVLLAYAFARLALKQIGPTLPSIVPSFHFFFYLKAVAAVLFGLGVAFVGRSVAWALRRKGDRPDHAAVLNISHASATLLCALLLVPHVNAFENRPDFEPARRAALITAQSDWMRTFDWLLAHHRPTDVALSTDLECSFLCAPTGTRAVCAGPGFSNPYVDLEPRRLARDGMFAALDSDDSGAFRVLADRYRVTHVITRSPRSERYDAHTPGDLQLAFSAGHFRVFLVKPISRP